MPILNTFGSATGGAHFALLRADELPSTRTFDVVEFVGVEAISQLYQFDIILASTDQNIVFSDWIDRRAILYLDVTGLEGEEKEEKFTSRRTVTGVFSALKYLGRKGTNRHFYRATLVPPHWGLHLNMQSRVFRNQDIQAIIDTVMNDADLASTYAFNLTSPLRDSSTALPGDTPPLAKRKREFCVQYRESDLNFVQRLAEFEGVYYYFDEAGKMHFIEEGSKEPPVAADAAAAAAAASAAASAAEAASAAAVASAADAASAAASAAEAAIPEPLSVQFEEQITKDLTGTNKVDALVYEERAVSKMVHLRDWNYRVPHYVTATTKMNTKDEDEDAQKRRYYDYGEPAPTQDIANWLARLRKEEITCTQRELTGISSCPRFSSGYRFKLTEQTKHTLRTDLKNRDFLLVKVTHRGSQASLFTEGTLGDVMTEHGYPGFHSGYTNDFTAIPALLQYRPPRSTPVPSLSGILTAKVEAKKEGHFDTEDNSILADIDDQGRYNLRMPFDIGNRAQGDATKRIRLAQPYSGPNYGLHFPNHHGTEMVFACLDGNLDRPIALGTVPNPSNHSPHKLADGAPTTRDRKDAAGKDIKKEYAGQALYGLHYRTEQVTGNTNIIRTRRDNRIIMEDSEDSEKMGISLYTPGDILAMGGNGITLTTVRSKEDIREFSNTVETAVAAIDLFINLAAGLALGASGKFQGSWRHAKRAWAALKGVGLAAIAGGVGWHVGKENPGIRLLTEGGLTTSSVGSTLITSALGIDLMTSAGVGITANLGVLIAGGGGVDLVALAGIPSGPGDVSFSAPAGSIKGKALSSVRLSQGTYLKPSKRVFEMSGDVGIRLQDTKTNITITADEGAVKINGHEKIVLQAGKTSLQITPKGVFIYGDKVYLNGQSEVKVHGGDVKVLGTQKATLSTVLPSGPIAPPIPEFPSPPVPPEPNLPPAQYQVEYAKFITTLTAWEAEKKAYEQALAAATAKLPTQPASSVEVTPTSVKVTAKLDLKLDSVMYDSSAKGISKEQAPLIKKN